MSEKLVLTGIVPPVCQEFETRFLESRREDVPVSRLRYLMADLVSRRLRVVEEAPADLIASVTLDRPRTGVLLGGAFQGFVVRQISRDGGFLVARRPQDELSDWYADSSITLADVPTHVNDDFWDEEYAMRKTSRLLGSTMLLDLGKR